MIKQGFNYTISTIKEMSDFFETRVENFEPKEEEKKSSSPARKTKKKIKKRKQEDSHSSIIEPGEESTEACCPSNLLSKQEVLHFMR